MTDMSALFIAHDSPMDFAEGVKEYDSAGSD
jgi:hypothetical protein